MKNNLPFIKADRKLLYQIILVVAAFLAMTLISSIYGSRIINGNVASYGNEVINSSVETLDAYLHESRITLDDIIFSVARLKAEGASTNEIYEEMVTWTDWMLNSDNTRLKSFISVYGVVNGEFIDGSHWKPGNDYVPESRPWYVGAVQARGGTFYSDPYVDLRTGKCILTLSRLVFDENGDIFGVVALDVYITSLAGYADGLRFMESGYGVLLDSKMGIVTHPEKTFIGIPMMFLSNTVEEYEVISHSLVTGKEVSALKLTDYNGVRSVAFFRQLFNGWYVGIISPGKIYYNNTFAMTALISVTGFILMSMLCVVIVFLHIERKRSDVVKKTNSSFLTNMSYEIRTPMNNIIGITELLLNEPLNSRLRDYISDINSSSHSLLGFINDIVDLSNIDAGKLEINPVDYDFHIFMDNICSMFLFVTQKKGLEFRYETVEEMPRCLFGDDNRLRQVLMNICGNTVKYTSSGYVRLKVSIKDETINFEIKDTGMGIRSEDLHKLFDPFSQTEPQRGKNIVGTTLGLPISKIFIEMMGGEISVESVYGQGTVYTFSIPMVIGNKSAIERGEDERKSSVFLAPSARILVVDDNELNLKVASGLLRMFKINVDTVLSGREAVELVQKTDYDIIFMDYMMPDMDGIETSNEIRRLGAKYMQLVIIALSAYVVYDAKEMFLSNGLNGFITKPIDIAELAKTLKEWLPTEKIEDQAKIHFSLAQPSQNSYLTQNQSEQDTSGYVSEDGYLAALRRIGINTDIGIERVSGSESMYREMLEFLCKTLPSEYEQIERYLTDGDLQGLAISAHSIKSSLSTIGAMDLSETAFKLETSAKNNEPRACENRLPGFLEELRLLGDTVSELYSRN